MPGRNFHFVYKKYTLTVADPLHFADNKKIIAV